MYRRALVAIDRDKVSAHQVLKAAQERAGELYILHVLQPQEIQYSVDPTFVGRITSALEKQAIDSATQRILSLCETSGITVVSAMVVLGHPATQIHQSAVEKQCDLIVLGTHGRRGWQRILGSTANAVLHGAPMDVLAHRIE